jgi:hypothetical protein
MSEGKARSLPWSGAPTLPLSVVLWPIRKNSARLKKPARDKHSSLFGQIINYDCKKFSNVEKLCRIQKLCSSLFCPWGQSHKTFLAYYIYTIFSKQHFFIAMQQIFLMIIKWFSISNVKVNLCQISFMKLALVAYTMNIV